MKINNHSQISCSEEGCFANNKDRHECTILLDTNFGDKECPFKLLKESRRRTTGDYIKCSDEECFACDTKAHECRILTNTDFGDRECPFKKDKYEFFRNEESR